MKIAFPFAAAVLFATAFAPHSARAAVTLTIERLPAANACQGSLPQFAGTLRARPLALANEGAGGAFVTCGASAGTTGRTVYLYTVDVTNLSPVTATVTCTGVNGSYVTRSKTLASGGSDFLMFTAGDFGRAELSAVRLNCRLPPGVEINTLLVDASSAVL